MARYGGTLVAATNAAVATEQADRQQVAIMNGSATDTIFVEFGQAATTTASDGCFRIPPQGALFLSAGEYPEIRGSINLISTGTPAYAVRTNDA